MTLRLEGERPGGVASITPKSRLVGLKRLVFATVCRGDVERYLRLRAALVRMEIRLDLYDRRHMKFIRRLVRPGDTTIDVGAGFGAYTIPLARAVGSSGVVLAFEPLPTVCDHLCLNVEAYPQVRCVREALSNCRGAVELRLPRLRGGVPEPSLASLEPSRASGGTSWTVEAKRLDDWLSQIEQLSFIKVDIEGHEFAFFEGAAQVIRSFHPVIQFEVDLAQNGVGAYMDLARRLDCQLRVLDSDARLRPVTRATASGAYNLYLAPESM